tara:strand:+ start:1932 stop:2261 length:330 start_codon:yes stop_codon:yes gene_type:complete
MRTPYGSQCSYYYEDLHRGRNNRECRLLIGKSDKWNVKLCKSCTIPRIQQCIEYDNLNYSAGISSEMFGLLRKVQVTAWCEESKSEVVVPELGCGQCHSSTIFDKFLAE